MCLLCFPAFAAESIDGFRDLKFRMTPHEVNALANCSTSYECLYELSGKNRYVQLMYGQDGANAGSDSIEPPRLEKISIDMGQYSEDWHNQLQMILGSSYRLTQDFTDEMLQAFLANNSEELRAGYEDGQIILAVVRRQFGNMVLKVVYQDTTLAAEFKRQARTALLPIP